MSIILGRQLVMKCGRLRVFTAAYSILKFKFVREEFSLLVTKFGSNSQLVQSWESWVNKVIEKPAYSKFIF